MFHKADATALLLMDDDPVSDKEDTWGKINTKKKKYTGEQVTTNTVSRFPVSYRNVTHMISRQRSYYIPPQE